MLGTRGFSIIEILLVIALVSIISAASFGVGRSYILRYRHQAAMQLIEAQLVSARTYSSENRHGLPWGVRITNAEAVLFAGDSYDTRTASHDFVVALPARVTATNTEVVFLKNSGFTSSTNTIEVSSEWRNDQIVINQLGVIE